jgi:hypothetical protein
MGWSFEELLFYSWQVKDFSDLQNIQTSCGTLLAIYSLGIEQSIPGG